MQSFAGKQDAFSLDEKRCLIQIAKELGFELWSDERALCEFGTETYRPDSVTSNRLIGTCRNTDENSAGFS
jgi:hypothetical protein